MKILVVEDDVTSSLLMRRFLAPYGEVHTAKNGREAVLFFRNALNDGAPYSLVCLDIMMPETDGREALKLIRALESNSGTPVGKGAKIIMTTALNNSKDIMNAFRDQCDAYLVKPIDHAKLVEHLQSFGMAA